MSNSTTSSVENFGLSQLQKAMYTAVPLMFSVLIVLYQPLLTGPLGTSLFILLGVLLGLMTFYVTAGWTFKLELGAHHIKVRDSRREVTVPMDKIGMVLKNARLPFPVIWLVLRNAEVGEEVPAKGVDPHARALIEAYQKRNPGKKLTIVQVPGGYVRSSADFAAEIKRRIPPVALDERFGVK